MGGRNGGNGGNGKWSYELCFELAKGCGTRSEFKRKHPYPYSISRRKGWLDSFDWFVNGRRKPRKYTYDMVYGVAMMFDDYTDFVRYDDGRYYNAAMRNGWVGGFGWLKRRHAEWTEEDCRTEAMKYGRKVDFQRSAPGAYKAARKKGWLKDYAWMEDCSIDLEYGRIYCVYRYLFDDGCVYVGLTMNRAKRESQHGRPRERGRRDVSAVRRHVEELERMRRICGCVRSDTVPELMSIGFDPDIDVPRMEILDDGLTQSEAREREDHWCTWHRERGYELLNRGSTGANVGSVGGMHRKWTKAKTEEEARKYGTRREFSSSNMGAYLAACRHGWIGEYDWMPKRAKPVRRKTIETRRNRTGLREALVEVTVPRRAYAVWGTVP